jgi:pilus assembly protein CpaE
MQNAVELVRDMRATLPARILVVGPAVDSKWILQLLREGVYQYIVQDDVKAELGRALGSLDEDSPADRTFGNLIVVLGTGGGGGASTLAANMAVSLSSSHGQCGLIDLRLASGDLAALFDLQPVHSLADFCRNVHRMDLEMFQQCLELHESGVQLLAAPNSYSDLGAVTPRGVRKALGMSRSLFDYVVVDLDGPYREEQLPALLQADTILLVIQLDFSSVRHAQRILAYYDELELDRDRIHLTVSRFGRPKELRIADVEKTLGMSVRYVIPDDSRHVNRANNRGRPVVLDCPRSMVSKRILDISFHVNGKPRS